MDVFKLQEEYDNESVKFISCKICGISYKGGVCPNCGERIDDEM